MSLHCVYPRDSSASSATVTLVAQVDGAPDPVVDCSEVGPLQVEWSPALAMGGVELKFGRAVANGLEPDREYSFQAGIGAAGLRNVAQVRTLPTSVSSGTAPLRLWLASCYCRLRHESVLASALFRRMRQAHGLPHLKVWSGDQVYLDSPWDEFMLRGPHSTDYIDESHVSHYLETWSSRHLGEALAMGANYFAPDDHEYWNNSPYWNAVVPELSSAKRRNHWIHRAQQLLSAFQPVVNQPVNVPPVSLLCLDTRSNRSPADRSRFMSAADLSKLQSWIAGLSGPGLLVLGQPVFYGKGASWWKPGVAEDYSYADFGQYTSMMNALASTHHDIAILTGDVHFSRVSRLTLPSQNSISQNSIYEIVCSPLTRVVGLGKSEWKPAIAPPVVPGSNAALGVTPVTFPGIQLNEEGAMALSISRYGVGVKIAIEFWPLSSSSMTSQPIRLTPDLELR